VTFQVLVVGIGDRHHPSTGGDARTPVTPEHRADGDGRVDVPGEVEVADHTGVGTALLRLELVDDLHRAHLRGAAHGPGRERRTEHVDRGLPAREVTRHLAGHVHDVRVPLERHELVDTFAAVPDNPSDVVAGQVDQHDVLGS